MYGNLVYLFNIFIIVYMFLLLLLLRPHRIPLKDSLLKLFIIDDPDQKPSLTISHDVHKGYKVFSLPLGQCLLLTICYM